VGPSSGTRAHPTRHPRAANGHTLGGAHHSNARSSPGAFVADEYANAVLRIGHKRTRVAAVPLPDDHAVISDHLIAVSLTGEVWEVAPRLRMLSSAFSPTTIAEAGLGSASPLG
jgi:hypothetical protein